MKASIIALLYILIAPAATTAQHSSGYFMVPSTSLSEEQNGYLEAKIKQSLASAGVTSMDGYYPMVTVGRYMEIEVQTFDGGMKTMYKVTGEITVSVEFEGAGASLASATVSVNGLGYTPEVARNVAIKSFKIQKTQVEDMFVLAAKRSINIINAYAENKMREVTALYAKKQCMDAADMIAEIPAGSKYEQEIGRMVKQISECVSEQMKRQEKKEMKAADRAYTLDSLRLTADERLLKIREQGMTSRTSIESRNKAKQTFINIFK